MVVLDWFRRRKSKIEEPLQATEQIPKKTKGEAKPRVKEARVEKKEEGRVERGGKSGYQEAVKLTESLIDPRIIYC